MHEMSIAQNILDIVSKEAKKANSNKIKKISIKLGPLAGIQIESLKFCFEVITENTMASGAELDFEEVELRVKCRNCSHEEVIDDYLWICTKCENTKYDIISGNEFQIKSIDAE